MRLSTRVCTMSDESAAGANTQVSNGTVVGQLREGGEGEPESLLKDALRDLRANPVFLVAAAVVVAMTLMAFFPGLFAGWFGHGNPNLCSLSQSGVGPSPGHPFGFTIEGCDYYASVIYGAGPPIEIGLLVTVGDVVLAVILGGLSGYVRGVVDSVVSRLSDVFFGFPFILGALIVLSVIPVRNVFSVALVLVVFGWPTMTRLMRASVFTQSSAEYVLAARALGASNVRILRKHIVPNAIAPVVVYATLAIGGVMVAESTLDFLGVGLQAPAISWGLELGVAQSYLQQYPYLVIFPATFLCVTVLAFILVGDALRDAFDPRLK